MTLFVAVVVVLLALFGASLALVGSNAAVRARLNALVGAVNARLAQTGRAS